MADKNYTFKIKALDHLTPVLDRISKAFHNITKSTGKLDNNLKKTNNAIKKVSHSFKGVEHQLDKLNSTYDKNRAKILRLKRESLIASDERKKQIRSEIRLLNQENAEIREQIRLAKRNRKTSNKPLASVTGGELLGGLSKVAGTVAVIGGAVYGAGKTLGLASTQAEAEGQVQTAINRGMNAGGYTLKDFKDMASVLQSKTTFGDEEILKNVTSVMQTFGNVTGDVFKQSQGLVLDMSARLGSDLKSTTIQLGKALNDPVKGISALSRVGVSFSDLQKQQIKSLMARGEKEKAQMIILNELNKEFGGSAEAKAKTFKGQLQQVMNLLGDIGEMLGGAIMPIVMKLIKGIKLGLEKIMPYIENGLNNVKSVLSSINFTEGINRLKEEFKSFISNIDFEKVKKAGQSIFKFIKVLFSTIKNLLIVLWKAIKEPLTKIINFFLGVIPTIMNYLKSFLKFIKAIGKLLGIVLKPVLDIIIWIGKLLWKNMFKPMIEFLTDVADFITKIINWFNKILGKEEAKGITKPKQRNYLQNNTTDNTQSNTLNFNELSGDLLGDTNGTSPTSPSNLNGTVNLNTDRSVKNFNINIGNLVEQFDVVVNNVQESADDIKEIFTQMLQEAVENVSVY